MADQGSKSRADVILKWLPITILLLTLFKDQIIKNSSVEDMNKKIEKLETVINQIQKGTSDNREAIRDRAAEIKMLEYRLNEQDKREKR